MDTQTSIPKATELLKAALAFYKTNHTSLLAAWLIPVMLSVFTLVLSFQFPDNTPLLFALYAITAVGTFLSYFAFLGTTSFLAHGAKDAQSVREVYASGAAVFLSAAWIYILSALVVIGVFVAGLLAAGAVAIVLGSVINIAFHLGSISANFTVIGVLLSVPVILFTILASLYLSQGVYIRVAEHKKGLDALLYSWHYVENRFSIVFSRGLIASLILLLSLVPGAIAAILAGVFAGEEKLFEPGSFSQFVSNVNSVVVNGVFVSPMLCIALYYFYVALKNTQTKTLAETEHKKKIKQLSSLAAAGALTLLLLTGLGLANFNALYALLTEAKDLNSPIYQSESVSNDTTNI